MQKYLPNKVAKTQVGYHILGNKLLVGLLIFTEQGHVDDHLELDNNRGCTVVKSAQSLLLCQLIIAIFIYDDCMKCTYLVSTQYLVHTYTQQQLFCVTFFRKNFGNHHLHSNCQPCVDNLTKQQLPLCCVYECVISKLCALCCVVHCLAIYLSTKYIIQVGSVQIPISTMRLVVQVISIFFLTGNH